VIDTNAQAHCKVQAEDLAWFDDLDVCSPEPDTGVISAEDLAAIFEAIDAIEFDEKPPAKVPGLLSEIEQIDLMLGDLEVLDAKDTPVEEYLAGKEATTSELEQIGRMLNCLDMAPAPAPANDDTIIKLTKVRASRVKAAIATSAPAAPHVISRVTSRQKRPVRSTARDSRTASKMGLFAKRSPAGTHAPQVIAPPSPLSFAFTPSNKPKTKKQRADENDTRAPARWSDTTHGMKTLFWNLALEGGLAFSCNLGPARIAEALADPKKALAALLRSMRGELAKIGWLSEMWFRYEVSPEARLHVHGGMTKGNHHPEAIRKALEHACGDGAGANQGDVRVQFHPAGWSRYCAKADATTKAFLGIDTIITATQPLKSAGARVYKAKRSGLMAA